MGRPHIEFIESLDVPQTDAQAPFEGARWRMLSKDEDGGTDYTALLSAPAGWSSDLGGQAGPTEFFVVQGELQVGGKPVGPGVYAFVPPGTSGATVSATEDTTALVLVDP